MQRAPLDRVLTYSKEARNVRCGGVNHLRLKAALAQLQAYEAETEKWREIDWKGSKAEPCWTPVKVLAWPQGQTHPSQLLLPLLCAPQGGITPGQLTVRSSMQTSWMQWARLTHSTRGASAPVKDKHPRRSYSHSSMLLTVLWEIETKELQRALITMRTNPSPQQSPKTWVTVGPVGGSRGSQKQPHVSIRDVFMQHTLIVFIILDHQMEKPDLEGTTDLCGRARCVSW